MSFDNVFKLWVWCHVLSLNQLLTGYCVTREWLIGRFLCVSVFIVLVSVFFPGVGLTPKPLTSELIGGNISVPKDVARQVSNPNSAIVGGHISKSFFYVVFWLYFIVFY